MTAHTRWDPETDDLYFYGYEASGLCSNDIAYCIADKNGKLTKEEHFKGPYVALMHDFVVTKEYAVFPFFPIVTNMDVIKAGKPHWIWDPTKESYFGIMPRDGSVEHLRWFKRPACSVFHFVNAFSEGSKVHVDACYSAVNPFPFITAASGLQHDPMNMQGKLVRWTFDMSKPGDTIEETDLGIGGDMPRVADKDLMKDFDIAYYETVDPELGPPKAAGPVGVGFNSLVRLEVKSGKMKTYSDGAAFHLERAGPYPVETGRPRRLSRPGRGRSQHVPLRGLGDGSREISKKARSPASKCRCAQRNQVHGNWVEADRLG